MHNTNFFFKKRTQFYSLWTCLHHVVIFKGQNKNTDFLMILMTDCRFNYFQENTVEYDVPWRAVHFLNLHGGKIIRALLCTLC